MPDGEHEPVGAISLRAKSWKDGVLRRILLPVGNLKERRMSDDPNAREEGFYWVVLGQNPPEIAYWERGEWWLAGDAKPARARHAWLQAKAASDERRLLLTRTKGFLGRERACRRGSSISAKKALI